MPRKRNPNPRTYRRITDTDHACILTMARGGVSPVEIARIMDRKVMVVRRVIWGRDRGPELARRRVEYLARKAARVKAGGSTL